MVDSDVQTVKQASEAVAGFEAPSVKLSDGSVVVVRKLKWHEFLAMYAQIGGIIQQYLEYQTTQAKTNELTLSYSVLSAQAEKPIDSGEIDKAQAAVREAFSLLAQRVIEAPMVMASLVSKTTGVIEDQQKDWDFDDVLAVALVALKVNFIDNKKVLGFFGGVMSAVNGRREESEKTE